MRTRRIFTVILSLMMIVTTMSPGVSAASVSSADGNEVKAAASTSMPFTDVTADDYYCEPVLWAVEQGITSGTSAETFSPEDTCTRGQVVTFLWRAAGEPEPSTSENPFTDVSSDAYYYKAVLWAVEKGITSGVSETEFAPDSPCTRGQVVTFQWRSSDKPDPASENNPFTDVSSDAYYYKAVLWAVEKKITSGVSTTGFAPDSSCTRGQIVTFLCRQSQSENDSASGGDSGEISGDPSSLPQTGIPASVSIKSIVTFGAYEQDNDLANGKEPIEWIVLKKENGKALLLSKYGLDAKEYNENVADVTWETCTLRSWLNSTFLNDAFSSSEQSQIPTTTVQNPDSYTGFDSNNNWVINNTGAGITDLNEHVPGGNATQDQVFLLSIDEAKSLLGFDKDSNSSEYPNMLASATAYAEAQGAWVNEYHTTAEGKACCWWWLRSPGYNSIYASGVYYNGRVCSSDVDYYGIAVRPALWVKLAS